MDTTALFSSVALDGSMSLAAKARLIAPKVKEYITDFEKGERTSAGVATFQSHVMGLMWTITKAFCLTLILPAVV